VVNGQGSAGRGTGYWKPTCPEIELLPSGYSTVRHGKSPFLIGKPSINGSFSMAMLNNQMVNLEILGPSPILDWC